MEELADFFSSSLLEKGLTRSARCGAFKMSAEMLPAEKPPQKRKGRSGRSRLTRSKRARPLMPGMTASETMRSTRSVRWRPRARREPLARQRRAQHVLEQRLPSLLVASSSAGRGVQAEAGFAHGKAERQ